MAGRPSLGRKIQVVLPAEVLDAADVLAEQRTTPEQRVTRSDVLRSWINEGRRGERARGDLRALLRPHAWQRSTERAEGAE